MINSSQEAMWIPVPWYMYLVSNDVRYNRLEIMKSKKKKPALSGDIDQIHPAEIYEGSKHYLKFSTYQMIEYVCTFKSIRNYPFGLDDCCLKIYLNGLDNKFATFDPVHLGTIQIY